MPEAWVSGVTRIYAKTKLTEIRFVATAKAMLDAVGKLVRDRSVCCAFNHLIVGKHPSNADRGQTDEGGADGDVGDDLDEDGLNPNQVRAVESSNDPLALIWGPPGTTGIAPRVNNLALIIPQAPGKPLWW